MIHVWRGAAFGGIGVFIALATESELITGVVMYALAACIGAASSVLYKLTMFRD